MKEEEKIKITDVILERSAISNFLIPKKSQSNLGENIKILELVYGDEKPNTRYKINELGLECDSYRTLSLVVKESFIKFEPIGVEIPGLSSMERIERLDYKAEVNSLLIGELGNLISRKFKSTLDELATLNMKNSDPMLYARGKWEKFKVWLFKKFGKKYFPRLLLKGNSQENLRRLVSRIFLESNIIAREGKRGPGNFVICSCYTATALQDFSGFISSPMSTKISLGGDIYPIGQISNLKVYVDPYMRWADHTIYVGRKPDQLEEPGIGFVYNPESITFESIQTPDRKGLEVAKLQGALYKSGDHPEYNYRKFEFKLKKERFLI